MAKVESLGVHTPVALSYLIKEGILPPEPKRELYQWETYVFSDSHGDVEEEVVATKHCVVWSQGSFIRNVYPFALEGEDVIQALLTTFPNARDERQDYEQTANGVVNGYNKNQGKSRQSVGQPPVKPAQTATQPSESATQAPSRALVVFLKTKVHVYYLQGSRHIVDLPFEIQRAFSAPRGCIIQRKPALTAALPPTPQVPAAPPNSFFSSQLQPTASFLQSPTRARGFGGSQPVRPSPLGGGSQAKLDALFQDVFGASGNGAEVDVTSLYSLTSPLSELGVLTYSLQHQKPRLAGKTQPGLAVEFETLDAAEEVVYVSSKDELDDGDRGRSSSLMLIVTANRELRSVTVWHAWYVEEKTLRSLFQQRAAQKAAKARRRSSFLSANMGTATGTATPAVRNRDATRDSLAVGSLRLPGDLIASQPAAPSSRKPTRQEEEAVMASQMDPDYQPAASQQNVRDSRRISSLNTDMRASQTAVNASFVGPVGRRNASFGGANDRKSFGHRKSRGSTPGSVFNHSLGPDDDLMELDSNGDFEAEESVESVIRHIRATFEAAGADSVFGSVDEGFRRELVLRKLHSFPISQRSAPRSMATSFRVATLKDSSSSPESDDHRLNVYVHDRATLELFSLKLMVKQRPLWPELAQSLRVEIPIVTWEANLGRCSDIVSLNDGRAHAVLLGGRGLILSTEVTELCPLPPPAPYRRYNTFDALPTHTGIDKDMGKNRTLHMFDLPQEFAYPGADGSFDEVDTQGVCHRRRLQLRPHEPYVAILLDVCQSVLPSQKAAHIRYAWCKAHAWLVQHSGGSAESASSAEFVALVAAMLAPIIALLDAKARAALNVSRLAAGKQKPTSSHAMGLSRQSQEAQLLGRSAWSWLERSQPTTSRLTSVSPSTRGQLDRRKDQLLPVAAALAVELVDSDVSGFSKEESTDSAARCAMRLMLGLHILREEHKLCSLSVIRDHNNALGAIVAQIGSWLGVDAWRSRLGSYYDLDGASEEQWAYVRSKPTLSPQLPVMDEPVGVFQWFEHALLQRSAESYPSLAVIAALDGRAPMSKSLTTAAKILTPRLCALSGMLAETSGLSASPAATVELMQKLGIYGDMLETLPEAVAAPFREAIVRCEQHPPTSWSSSLLQLVGREDLQMDGDRSPYVPAALQTGSHLARDLQTICHASDNSPHPRAKTREAGRLAICLEIFSEDRRLLDAVMILHYQHPHPQIGECPRQLDWTDAQHFEQQRRVMHLVALRMLSLPAGDGMVHFRCDTPLLTEKYSVPGFSSSCLMQPMGNFLTIDRTGMSEEKYGWAYFHAGVSAGVRISQNVKGIDTSWIAFNKPTDLTNRHAGLLLALGLGGHLRSLAKWLSFKYLTPKHTMTSVGLLLGLSASYLGTMDSLITRMLSVHITRMLPPGAAELNVSPITQTAGLMGIGLLYYNTQHRRMSEIMLSEIEYMEVEDPDSGPDPLRDESYRLAAGFALGLINIGKGRTLRGLHGMYLPERLLTVAVGPRPVHAVHVFDRATAGAIMAIALIYMKSGDRAIARKIDVPDTKVQFGHVRPDMLMLRAMARHIITWDNIVAQPKDLNHPQQSWIHANLPLSYKGQFREIQAANGRYPFRTSEVPFYNIVTGLAWALALKHAGSGNKDARDEVLTVLDLFYMISGGSIFYDAKLARTTVRRCIDVLALSAAMIMAGTGDLQTFRYLRRLHGRIDAETPYGSHLAAHMAIGMLFMGGGTYTLGTSDFAIASLMCAFYPLFPVDVHDNRVHLQAFRHFWIFAAEARCLVIENIDTRRPVKMPIVVTMRDGAVRSMMAPCLLPELDEIASVQTDDPAYWRVMLDFIGNPAHLSAFRKNQTVHVRRCPASEAHNNIFSAMLAALNDAQSSRSTTDVWQCVFNLPAVRELDKADIELILPPDLHSSMHTDERGTVVDDRLALRNAAGSGKRDTLWNLKVLFAWAERAKAEGDGRSRWLGNEVIEALKARIEARSRSLVGVTEE
ncbi:hypothetical protein LTR36_007517 [Oleoguttula mirabilis]|uniref:Anaphase-promoting complex subunit 1 n=1 Tax=Oleoguttula mirabilis TaxID=1507867 RepID=A0AAV9JTM3_9PEZI|nr:hypothetical protein LTR36_007517 [Oleoguttula mirabilis]